MIEVGDKIQWTINGADQFAEPQRVRIVTECGQYCFVDGSDTGLAVAQVTVIVPVKPPQAVDATEALPEKFTLFWRGPLSQWYPSKFSDGAHHYNCAEQYMMAQKALMFEDFKSHLKIMGAKSPSDQKKFGRKVDNFDEDRWNAEARSIVYQGNQLKFTQNPSLLDALMATLGTTLVEASPYDTIWGIGLSESDPRAHDRSTWQGTNWLGEVLTTLRENLWASLPNLIDKAYEKMKIKESVV